MGETIITWNWANWITVGLMGMAFFALLGFGIQLYTKQVGSTS